MCRIEEIYEIEARAHAVCKMPFAMVRPAWHVSRDQRVSEMLERVLDLADVPAEVTLD